MNKYEREWLYVVAGSEELPAEVLSQLYPHVQSYGPNYEAVLAYADAMAFLTTDGYPLWLKRDLIRLQTDGINNINTNLILNRQLQLLFHDQDTNESEQTAAQSTVAIQKNLQELVKNYIHSTDASKLDYQDSYLHNTLMSVFYVASIKGAYRVDEIKELQELSSQWEARVKETLEMAVKLAS